MDKINWNSITKKRYADNMKILQILSSFFEAYPDMRFSQSLLALGILEVDDSKDEFQIKDPFYEEPSAVLNRIKKNKALESILEPKERL